MRRLAGEAAGGEANVADEVAHLDLPLSHVHSPYGRAEGFGYSAAC